MFPQDLAMELVLTTQQTACTIPTANIKNFSFSITSYGFSASIDFWLDSEEDTLFPLFIQPLLMEVKFGLQSYYNPPDPLPIPIVLLGLVVSKKMDESTFQNVEGIPIWYRHYFIEFADPAAVLWKQHFPCCLFVDKTMKDVIVAQKNEKITLVYELADLNTTRAVIFLGNSVSFYDFLCWYLHNVNGLLLYDIVTNKYTITGEKSDKGQKQTVDRQEVESRFVYFPEVARHKTTVMNGYSESPTKEDVANEQEVSGVYKGVLVRTPIPADVTATVALEGTKLVIRQHEIVLHFKKFPTLTIHPGYSFWLPDTWGEKSFTIKDIFRIFQVKMKAVCHQTTFDTNYERPLAGYDMEIEVYGELKAETYLRYPAFTPPQYPIYVEGKLLSETGTQQEETYQFYQDANSQDVYKVQVPLWQNQKVIVSFHPNLFTGHFYFPVYKYARVLLAFEFQRAWIKTFLDWRPGAKLPLETQGNQILFGLTQENKTSINHVYQDQKPIFNILRTLAKDTEMIQLKEGTMILQTKEEP